MLARRLVEAGATLVTVNWHDDGRDVKSPFWDTHKDNFATLKNVLIPPLDPGSRRSWPIWMSGDCWRARWWW